jgi:DNA repair protein RecO (recombination protein O)
MLQTIQGLILRTVKYAESSVICDVYTREHGLRTYIMSGVRQQKSKIGPALVRPMGWVEMVVYHRDDRDINRVKEIKPAYIYRQIPFDLIRGSLGLFMTELTQKSIKETGVNLPLYEFLLLSFGLLDEFDGRLSNFHLSFMVKLTQYLGFMPESADYLEDEEEVFFDFQEGDFVPEKPAHIYCFSAYHSRLLLQFLEKPITESGDIRITGEVRHRLIEDLIRFYQFNIEHLQIHSHEVLHQVLG